MQADAEARLEFRKLDARRAMEIYEQLKTLGQSLSGKIEPKEDKWL